MSAKDNSWVLGARHDPVNRRLSLVPVLISPATCNRLATAYEMQKALCARLERIADRLPHEVDRADCLTAAQTLAPMLRMAHLLEEEILLTTLRRLGPNEASTAKRLEFEHWEDESFADEIAEALCDFLETQSHRAAQSLGYMLRGFFLGLRRHIAFEQEHLLPVLSARS